jgi:hypothetical protein
MPSEEQWIRTQHDKLEPLIARVAPGRSNKLRKRGVDESRDSKNAHKIRKFGEKMKCFKCQAKGHHKRACPMNRNEASVQLPITSVELPTPPPANVSFLFVLLSSYVIIFDMPTY